MPRSLVPLYMLPFDHRESFAHGLFGWSGTLAPAQIAQITGAKQVVYEAVLSAIADGVPQERAAVLVDEQFGRQILADARTRGLVTACPVEKSGQGELELEYGEEFAGHIETVDPTYCKVLVRYDPYGDRGLNERQLARLRRLSGYLQRTRRRFLLELLVPQHAAQLVLMAMREMQNAGVEPDVWRVQGCERTDECVAIVDMAQRGGRSGVSCIVLGSHADEARVRHWLEVAALVSGFVGFAIGRTTFWDPLQDLIARRIDRDEAVARIARTYRGWVDIWETARGERATPGRQPGDGGRRARAVEVYADGDTLVRAEADRVIALSRAAIAVRGRFALALSGGETPRPLYELLAEPAYSSQIDWSRVHVFWGDERCVPPDDPESNYRMARETLLDRVPIPDANVHRIAGEDEPHEAARAYEQMLHAFFGVPEGLPDRSFDAVLLGMGEDGHTASLFPGTPPVTEERRWVMANHITEPREMWRITLTPVVLNAAGVVTFLVAGADKAPRLREAIEGDTEPSLPVQRIRPTRGALNWMVDAAAATDLRRSQ